MAKKKLTSTGNVVKMGYNNFGETIIYVASQNAELYGTTAMIKVEDGQHNMYNVEWQKKLMNKEVEFSYDSYDASTKLVKGGKFVKWIEEVV
jgi:hypothetical protein